jgi:hypothetical protein
MKGDFIPTAKADLDTWEANFAEKLGPIAQALKLEGADTAATLVLLQGHRQSYTAMEAKHAEAKAATSTNQQAQKLAVQAYRQVANRIKSANGYTEAIGKELRIIGAETGFDRAMAKPVLAVSRQGNGIVVRFIKDKTDGIHLYSRRAGEKEFSFLAADTISPYTDKRPNLVPGQSEVREYKAWHFKDDEVIGQESDVASIAV